MITRVKFVESRTGIGKADALAIHGLQQPIEPGTGVADADAQGLAYATDPDANNAGST